MKSNHRPVIRTVAARGVGVGALCDFIASWERSENPKRKRAIELMISTMFKETFFEGLMEDGEFRETLEEGVERVYSGEIDFYDAVAELKSQIKKKSH